MRLLILILLTSCVGEITNDADECFYARYSKASNNCNEIHYIK